jgi:hypothetical protein
MRNLKFALLVSAFSLAATLSASWSLSIKLTYSGPCPAGSTISYGLPSATGMPKRQICESLRAQVLAIKQCVAEYGGGPTYPYIGDCCVFYTCSACQGSDDDAGGAGAAGGNFNSGGAAQGKAFFSNSANTENKDWAQETQERVKALGGEARQERQLIQAPSTGHKDYDDAYARQMAKAYADPKVWKNLPTTYEAGDERTTEDEEAGQEPFKAAGTDEAAVAQPVGGAGITQGKADTPPPPNPEKAARLGECRKGWYYNPISGQCFSQLANCEAGAPGSKGKCQGPK